VIEVDGCGRVAPRETRTIEVHEVLAPVSFRYLHRMRLTFQDIDHFLALSDARSRHEAAASLGMTPSALSRVVQRVEAEFGLVLFVRHARALSMTKEGERLAFALRQMSTGYAVATGVIARLRGDCEGRRDAKQLRGIGNLRNAPILQRTGP
jgi:DNA-binding MarR family transcriptional regulator